VSSRFEWCEIKGLPTDEEREVLLSSLEQYLGSEPAPSAASWTEGTAPEKLKHAVTGWGGTGSWSGLQSFTASLTGTTQES
jgi:hypothetical protein